MKQQDALTILSWTGQEDIYMSNISNLERLFSYTWSHTINQESGSGMNLTIESGNKYLTSFRDIRKQYSFSGTGYTIKQEWIGEVLIDTQSKPGKVLIFPINSPLTVTLHNVSKTQEYTDIYMTPHMYLELQPSRWKFLKNADVLRVQTVYKIGYIAERILYWWDESPIKIYDISENGFLWRSFKYIWMSDVKTQKLLSQFEYQEVGKISWWESIQRYTNLFVNDEKKKIFYKNMILSNLLKLVELRKYDQVLVNTLQKDFVNLRELDEESYQELVVFREKLNEILSSDYRKDYIIPKMALANLSLEEDLDQSIYFPLYSYSLFSLYEISWDFSPNILHKFLQSFSTFAEKKSDNEVSQKLRSQYFSYFLEWYLSYLLENGNRDEDLDSIIDTLTNYINISQVSYGNTITSRVTLLYVYNEILEKIDNFLRKEYFLEERNAGGILEKDWEHKASVKSISWLEKLTKQIFEIFDNQESILDDSNTRDSSIKKDILLRRERFKEYFLALTNYELYVQQYDQSKQNVLNLDIFDDEDSVLSVNQMHDYLSWFFGLDLENASIEIIDDYFFHIENVFIVGSRFDFDIYPYASYKIENIVKDGEKSSFVYKLWLIEWLWEEKKKVAIEEERWRYDFSRFFLLTFFADNSTTVEEYIKDDVKLSEDKTEIIFKRDWLLGDKWEFSDLKWFLKIEYNDLKVVKDNLLYDIFINDAELELQISNAWSVMNQVWLLNAQYILNDTDHYFTDIGLRLYRNGKIWEDYILFWWKVFEIQGNVNITDLEKVMENVISPVILYDTLYNSILWTYPNVDIQLVYSVHNQKMSFKFDYEGKKYTILLADNMIEKIYKGTQKLISQPINIVDITDYLE